MPISFVKIRIADRLGTSDLERRAQGPLLLSDEMLNHAAHTGPRVIMGDFNEWTRGLTSRLMATVSQDRLAAVPAQARQLSRTNSCVGIRSHLLRPSPSSDSVSHGENAFVADRVRPLASCGRVSNHAVNCLLMILEISSIGARHANLGRAVWARDNHQALATHRGRSPIHSCTHWPDWKNRSRSLIDPPMFSRGGTCGCMEEYTATCDLSQLTAL